MKVDNRKGRIYPLAFFSMLLLLRNAYCSDAAFLLTSNSSFGCNGLLDECLIEEELELEFLSLMNPYLSRILGDGKGSPNYENPNDPIFKPCGKPNDPQYAKCIDDIKKKHHGVESKGIYGGRTGSGSPPK
ncbi:hypothetical protein CJ030_MR6G013290 [Morella rubra]|uniref:Uncharacterized protein n=1 Tax=Morella rubra TaxID=262757 RepID=A0A6A1VI89_9ROSI|nr:hypothetical protein CJ030_MR6G013290 [Morella rubra]